MRHNSIQSKCYQGYALTTKHLFIFFISKGKQFLMTNNIKNSVHSAINGHSMQKTSHSVTIDKGNAYIILLAVQTPAKSRQTENIYDLNSIS